MRCGPMWMLVMAVGCSGQLGGSQVVAHGSWMLLADETLALVDTRCRGDDCPRYPNPDECGRLEVRVLADGQVCGHCSRDGAEVERCGGPAQGLPYRCSLQIDGAGQACVACDDLFGNHVYRDCAPGSVASPDRPGLTDQQAGRCFDLRRVDGSPCSVCLGTDSRVKSDDCASVPENVAEVDPPTVEGAVASTGACITDPSAAVMQGRKLFGQELNGILTEAGLAADYSVQSTNLLDSSNAGGVELGGIGISSVCTQQVEEAEGGPDAEGWVRNGNPRCGYMLSYAWMRACWTVDECNSRTIEAGLTAEMGRASTILEERYPCTGSPLVLDLDGDGVETEAADARFDISAIGREVKTAWIRRGDALLAMDRDGDGRISSGAELFGEVTPTPTGLAGDGFAALRLLDSSRDGRISAEDGEFGRLLLWRDNGDGVSDPAELEPLGDAGIARLELAAVSVAGKDASGSIPALWSRFERSDGSAGVLCDVFFAKR